MGQIARVLDEFWHRHGAPIRIVSFYRSPSYNAARRGAANSLHLTGSAIDFTSPAGSPSEWASLLREMRAEGLFTGGVGVLQSFVQVDLREYDADWGDVRASQERTE